jgi:hypothetical protein
MKTTCIFYGENNLCEFLLELPIELGYRHELPINKVNDKVFPFDDCKIVCYVLKDGKKLWERKVKNINNVFECRDRLYCVQNEVGIIILSAMTGEQISKIACFRKGWSMPNVIRINERHLMKCTPFGRQF